MTTAAPPHGPSANSLRRGFRLLLAILLVASALPTMAANTPSTQVDALAQAAAARTAAAQLTLIAPVPIATPDTAPLAAQLQALSDARNTPSTSSHIKSVLQRAFSLLGTPYRWGGTSPESGFDCSGLVGYVFRTIGIDLPRVSRAMAHEGTAVANRDALTEGDLVFFGKRGRIDHVGIYIGDGKFLHAPRTGRDVSVSSLTNGYWAQKYMQARRIATGG